MSIPRYDENGVKTDCFGYCGQIAGRPPKCLALDGLYCATGPCNFYKPKEVQEDLIKKYGGTTTQKQLNSKMV